MELYSNTGQFKIATTPRTVEKQYRSSPHIPPHQRIAPSYIRKDNDRCFKCNSPNGMLDHKYAYAQEIFEYYVTHMSNSMQGT